MGAVAIGIHNFPEGLATFLATVANTWAGASLGVAIAIHNIPEGLCVAMPIYYATGNKWKAFRWSLLSGVTEPIGGIIGFAALQPVFTDMVFGMIFSMVGGNGLPRALRPVRTRRRLSPPESAYCRSRSMRMRCDRVYIDIGPLQPAPTPNRVDYSDLAWTRDVLVH